MITSELLQARPVVLRLPLTLPTERVHETCALAELYKVLEQFFYKPDLQAIRIVLGTIQAHRLGPAP
jgi:hypothetical protein